MTAAVEMKPRTEVGANGLAVSWEDPPAKLEALADAAFRPFEIKIAKQIGALVELPEMVHLDKLERAHSQAQRDVDDMLKRIAELKANLSGDVLIAGRLAEAARIPRAVERAGLRSSPPCSRLLEINTVIGTSVRINA